MKKFLKKSQIPTFVSGYICGIVEKKINNYLDDDTLKNIFTLDVEVSKRWLSVRCPDSYTSSPSHNLCDRICAICKSVLEEEYPGYEVSIKYDVFKCWETFKVCFKHREYKKMMTISEVEEALGYKIEIIEDTSK